MFTEKLKELVNNSDKPQMQKNVMIGLITRAEQEENAKQETRQLIEQVTNRNNISEIIISTNEVKIYTVNGKDDWDIKYPYRSIFVNKKGVWERATTVSPSLDIAYLIYLQHKHIGINSQFADFAIKMLDINIED